MRGPTPTEKRYQHVVPMSQKSTQESWHQQAASSPVQGSMDAARDTPASWGQDTRRRVLYEAGPQHNGT